MSTVEIRVRPVVRYVVTRYTPAIQPGKDALWQIPTAASLETLGEFDNEAQAESVASALRAYHSPKVGDTILVDGMSAEIWQVTECVGRRIFDVCFPGTPRNPAVVEDRLPYTAMAQPSAIEPDPDRDRYEGHASLMAEIAAAESQSNNA